MTVPATRGGETFDANEIDTPYRATFVPSPAYGYATGFSGGFSGPFPGLGDRPVFVERGTDDDRVGT